MKMQQQRILVRLGMRKIPGLLAQELVVLKMDARTFVVGNEHAIGRGLPFGDFVVCETGVMGQLSEPLRITVADSLKSACGRPKIFSRHQVSERVVIDNSVVFVRSRDAVDAE